MPDTSTAFPLIENMTPAELEQRRAEIVRSAMGDYDNLPIDTLKELAAVTGCLRRKTAGPPKGASRKKATPAKKLSVEDIFGAP